MPLVTTFLEGFATSWATFHVFDDSSSPTTVGNSCAGFGAPASPTFVELQKLGEINRTHPDPVSMITTGTLSVMNVSQKA